MSARQIDKVTLYVETAFHLLASIVVILVFRRIWNHDWSANGLNGKPIFLIFFAGAIFTFYWNTYWLIPKFLGKKRWFIYTIILAIYSLVLVTLRAIILGILSTTTNSNSTFVENFQKEFFSDINVFGAIVMGLILSLAYRFTRDWIINLNVIARLEAEKTEMELAFLKSQIDPHFLFNTLNNLYGLALEEKSYKTADGIAKLGTLMRYTLHDASADSILLSKEIEYLQKYIELQKLRISPDNVVIFNNEISESQGHGSQIAPMLLGTFVENAFKYGTSHTNPGKIKINLKLVDSALQFQITNQIITKEDHQAPGGLGLKNVINRLELIYPDNHQLEYKREAGIYKVYLQLNLSQ